MTDVTIALADTDLASDQNRADPFPYFAELVEQAPVLFNRRHRAWLVSSYDLVCAALRNPAIGSDRISPYVSSADESVRDQLGRMFDILSRWMVFVEPPDHTRLRSLVQRSFTPRRVAVLEQRATAIAGELADRVAEALARDGEVDLMGEYCAPYPGMLVAEMFGVPPEDGAVLREWAEVLGLFINGTRSEPGRDERVASAMAEFEDYLRGHIEAYRAEPQDNIFSGLVTNEGDQALSDTELIAMCMLVLDSGYKTVQNALANALFTLMDHPDDWERLASDPDRLPGAVEECLRYMGSGTLIIRRASADVTIGEAQIHAGDRVYLVSAGANRDPAKFERASEFDIDRSPNPHLSFGQGIHYCLGAALARMEMRVGLAALLERVPRLELAAPATSLNWHRALILHGVERLPARIVERNR
jgi:cytochrome P450